MIIRFKKNATEHSTIVAFQHLCRYLRYKCWKGSGTDTEKGINFRTLKSKCDSTSVNKTAKKSLDTLKGEKVKSVSGDGRIEYMDILKRYK